MHPGDIELVHMIGVDIELVHMIGVEQDATRRADTRRHDG